MIYIFLIIAIILLIVLFKNMDEIVRDKSIPTYKLKRNENGITLHFWDVEKRKWLSPIKEKQYYNLLSDDNNYDYDFVNIVYTDEREIDSVIRKYEDNIERLRKDIKSVIDRNNRYYDDLAKENKKKYLDAKKEYQDKQEELSRIENKYK